MHDVLLVLIGALAGGLATGGVSVWEVRSRRKGERRVAARLVLGDLAVIEAACKALVEAGRWPDLFPMENAISTWHEQRAAFAADVTALEWGTVDSVYNTLGRVIAMVRLGQPLSPNDRDVLKGLGQRAGEAGDIVIRHAVSKKDQAELNEKVRRATDGTER